MKTEIQPDTEAPPAKRHCRRDSSSSSTTGKEGHEEAVRPDEISSFTEDDAASASSVEYDGPYGRIRLLNHRICPLPSRSGKTDLLILVLDRPNEERKWVAMEFMKEHYQKAIKDYASKHGLVVADSGWTTLSAAAAAPPSEKKRNKTTTSMDNIPAKTNKKAVAVKTELGYETVFQFKIEIGVSGDRSGDILYHETHYDVFKEGSDVVYDLSELEVRTDMSTGKSYIAMKIDEFWQNRTGLVEFVIWPDTFARAKSTSGYQDGLHFYEGRAKGLLVVGSVSDINEIMKYFPNLPQSDHLH